jgi:hypothetical protein
MPHVYAPDRNSAPNDLVPARARGLPEMLTVIEQHKPEAQITDICMPPTGRDDGIQAAAGCHLAVDTPATAGVRGLHVHNDDLRARARIAAANLPPRVIGRASAGTRHFLAEMFGDRHWTISGQQIQRLSELAIT